MSMKQFEGNIKSITDTPFGYTLTMIGGITYRTLSSQLKEMEADGLITRTEYPQIPPKVEYRLSEKGKSLYPIMESMCAWGEKNQ